MLTTIPSQNLSGSARRSRLPLSSAYRGRRAGGRPRVTAPSGNSSSSNGRNSSWSTCRRDSTPSCANRSSMPAAAPSASMSGLSCTASPTLRSVFMRRHTAARSAGSAFTPAPLPRRRPRRRRRCPGLRCPALLLALHERLDVQGVVERTVVDELQLRRALHVQRRVDARLQEPPRLVQRLHRGLALGLLAEHADVDLGVTLVGRGLHAGDRHEPHARVL